MYKDKEVEREATRERMRRYRGRQKGVTRQGVTTKGVTLSDGQIWYPNNYGYHPRECRCKAHPDRTWMTDPAYEELITTLTIIVRPLRR